MQRGAILECGARSYAPAPRALWQKTCAYLLQMSAACLVEQCHLLLLGLAEVPLAGRQGVEQRPVVLVQPVALLLQLEVQLFEGIALGDGAVALL